MRILIEDHEYLNPEIKAFLRDIDQSYKDGRVPFVGYFYSKKKEDCVFFLPKVILYSNGKVLGKYNPDDLWNYNQLGDDIEFSSFLYEFSIYTYQAVNTYNRRNGDNIIVRKHTISNPDGSSKEVQMTLLDKILSLIKFANDNKSFLLFKIQNIHSGNGRINWSKTITRQNPILKKGKAPIYLNTYTKDKEIDYEEELLVIYFSILQHIRDKYKFKVDINLNYNLISESQFNSYLKGEGVKRLRDIRYKYYSDRTLKLWQLCMAFFEGREKCVKSSNSFEDYLFANKFDRIFEAMVDDLIARPKDSIPKHIKCDVQEDGKTIDHLFSYDSLIDADLLSYYIADSKYYTTVTDKKVKDISIDVDSNDKDKGKKIKGDSLFKQFTYARNLIQERISNPKEEKLHSEYSVCRDDKTEGYNIIPNFFLSAYIDRKLCYDFPGIEYRNKQDDKVYHFSNRLFDRETLLVSHYDINFLYVIKQYANSSGKETFRKELHEIFRNNLLTRLNGGIINEKKINGEYLFSILELRNKPSQGHEEQTLHDALYPNFRIVNGKVFCPKKDSHFTYLILALENPNHPVTATKSELEKENQLVKDALKKDFIIHDGYKLGIEIDSFLSQPGINSKG